jgi:pilus assembly protein CpaF
MVDARLKDGSRVNAIIPPLALKGPSLTIRKFASKRLRIDDLISLETLSASMASFLELCVSHRQNIVVSGGTGSGKTTFLNVLSACIPSAERIITIEDAAELQLHHPNLVSLEARPANAEGRGFVSIRDLVRNSLRMRPDRIVVGECRGGEALDMLQAMNTGHEGSLTTLHANSPRDALMRLETLVLMAGDAPPLAAIRDQIASAVDIIVQQTRFACGSRKITSITEVCGMEGGRIQLQEIFRFQRAGRRSDGRVAGAFEACDCIPSFYESLRDRGESMSLDCFRRAEA